MVRKKREIDKPIISSIRTENSVRKYRINGRIYTFAIGKIDGGIPYGYCHAHKIWAWLFDDYIHDTNGNMVRAEWINK